MSAAQPPAPADGSALRLAPVESEAERSRGHGHRLLEALAAEARAAGCRRLVLDSAVGNGPAHRFYFGERLVVTAFHFSMPLG